MEYNEDKRLEIETRNWSRKVAKETRSLADLHDKINQVTNKSTIQVKVYSLSDMVLAVRTWFYY